MVFRSCRALIHFHELHNLVLSIEEANANGLLVGTELFLFTDNTAADSTFSRGASSNKSLFDLVLHLRTLEMHHGQSMHVIHIAGLCMQAQGTNGLSRGSVYEGTLNGTKMMDFVLLHRSAVDREPALVSWKAYWTGDMQYKWLMPFDWFTQGHLPGWYIRCPPPATADTCLEQIAIAFHKRPASTQHIVLVPCYDI